ncbi:MAG TPA: sulfatase-like hydrolase/transferase [Acetobacteraceae bacterium]|jgi:choline-sulfatase|nr:sulfatase-like hydrolase/transferase [Acetobacteraceae bacterium]
MTPTNLLFIMSDEHSKRIMGCAGHPMIRTPNMDRLAATGVRFTDAYCNSPICVPSRASFATGRYVHRIRFWDNAIPYDGSIPSWGHRLQQNGNHSAAIGKLHFRAADEAHGFGEEIMPLHVVNGGDPLGLLRDDLPVRKAALKLATDAGRGESTYQQYDERITDAAVAWLTARAQQALGKPWVLFVSLVCPHFPLIARPEWYDLYPEADVPWPPLYDSHDRPTHPFIAAIRECMVYDKAFDEAKVRKAIAAYFGMVSFVDHNVGRMLRALEATGLIDNTRVIYTSDHGDNLGTRGLWGKSTMYEDSAGVPLLMSGPEIPEGHVVREPVSLVDGFPTILDCVGAPLAPGDADLPGASLLDVMRGCHAPRIVFSEYHAAGAATGAFMIRRGPFKYVHYVGMPPQLFDIDADPLEARDLGQDLGYAGLVADCEAMLRTVCDPEAVDALARADQAEEIRKWGGRDAIIARGSFGYSPVPGQTPVYT